MRQISKYYTRSINQPIRKGLFLVAALKLTLKEKSSNFPRILRVILALSNLNGQFHHLKKPLYSNITAEMFRLLVLKLKNVSGNAKVEEFA